ncbi:uncharacterized protein LOC108659850 [Drosophila navojoa]|uniref:uncharacterized protein LOC108659850 n=1 Tax=Drosophila navojoa TaxID=7232 RepID=UPI0008472910|nr:uncharacterized protein LOC108659850 [Drosophila navojoa]
MCINNRARLGPPAAPLLLPIVLLLASLGVCQGDVMKVGEGISLPATGPLLNVENAGSSDLEQLIEAKLNESASSRTMQTQELLSRKRRYLVFPEGSSFQMVFDEIICVVDYTNYLVLGITVALAWELPSKPPSEAIEDILNKLEDGTIDVSRNDTVSNITYVDDTQKDTEQNSNNNNNANYKPNYINLSNGAAGSSSGSSSGHNSYYSNSPVFRTPMHPTYRYSDSFYRRPSEPARRKDNHYYYSRPVSSMRNPFQSYSQPYSRAPTTRYPYWALASHLRNTLRHRNSYYSAANGQRQRNGYYQPAESAHKPRSEPRRHHQIYPVYGKRSLPDAANPHHRHRRSGVASVADSELTRMENIQIKYHRSSRQTLYGRIEKYLDKRGHDGHQCVLRTLCETGQKSHEQEPGSFVGELLRAVFTIPEALDHEPVAYRDTRYDKAHAHDGDCAALYPKCKMSIWDAPFVQ